MRRCKFFLSTYKIYISKVKPSSTIDIQRSAKSSKSHGLGDSDSDDEEDMFDPIPLYKQILEFLKPGETVSKALCRLGKHNY